MNSRNGPFHFQSFVMRQIRTQLQKLDQAGPNPALTPKGEGLGLWKPSASGKGSQVIKGKPCFPHGCFFLVIFPEIRTTRMSSQGKPLSLQPPGLTSSRGPAGRTTRSSASCSPIDRASKVLTAPSGPSTSSL